MKFENFLMIILISITAYFGWTEIENRNKEINLLKDSINTQQQEINLLKDSINIQSKFEKEKLKLNIEKLNIDKSTLKPTIIPTEYFPPAKLGITSESQFSISNEGNSGTSYNLTITSANLLVSKDKKNWLNEIRYRYFLSSKNGKNSIDHTFWINQVKGDPVNASYSIQLFDEKEKSKFHKTYCYKFNPKSIKYNKIQCTKSINPKN